jgi:alkylhydroperoxidase family enzyme
MLWPRSQEEQAMTWIRTVPLEEASQPLLDALDAQRALYPVEYATPVHPAPGGASSEIVMSHSLIPEALRHAFATFGVLLAPELPLTRRQHEMITTVVSAANRCHY